MQFDTLKVPERVFEELLRLLLSITKLSRYIKKLFDEETKGEDLFPTTTVGYTRNRQVFTDAQEIMIVEYLLKASDIYFGLLPKECPKFAYRFAEANRIEIPKSWYDKQQTSPDWFTSI